MYFIHKVFSLVYFFEARLILLRKKFPTLTRGNEMAIQCHYYKGEISLQKSLLQARLIIMVKNFNYFVYFIIFLI